MSKFYYLLKGTLYRSRDNNPNDLIEISEVFENDNPIEARERIFEVYQNYVDVLLESQEEKYSNHESANQTLNPFLVKEDDLDDLLQNPQKIKYPQPNQVHDFDKGLSIFLISKDSKTFTTQEGELIYEDKLLIHDLNSELPAVREHMYAALLKEYALYQKYGYDCKDYLTALPKILATNHKEAELILRTPINYEMEYIKRYL